MLNDSRAEEVPQLDHALEGEAKDEVAGHGDSEGGQIRVGGQKRNLEN